MEDLIQQVAHWKSRLTVAAFNQNDWIPPYQRPKRPPIYENRNHDDAHDLLRRFFEEPRHRCKFCGKTFFGVTSCPIDKCIKKQEAWDKAEAKKELEAANKLNRKKRSTWDIHYENKSWEEKLKEQAAEKERQNEEARAQGYNWKTAEGYIIPGPDFLPGVYCYAHELTISDELWQTWKPREKVEWMLRHG